MFAQAIYATHGGCCASGDPRYDLREHWRAMTGRGGSGSPGRGGRHGHHGGHGPRDFGPGGRGGFEGFPFGGFGPGPGGGGGRFGRRSRKARRGDIRTAALLLLAEEPRNGYQIMQELQERSEGVWRPSPGSVYPALQQLEDEGLIRAEEGGGRTGRVFELTEAGTAHVNERDADASAPWEQMSGDVSDQAFELMGTMREVGFAFTQVMRTGSEAQIAEARKLLVAVRRDLYRILADGDPTTSGAED
ncbi:MAG TPA: PadR family transcriptional regulator [Solirubrobacteraceae bacterium]|jgi:DNA-binding PadR family transcriptional regulator|nr:PadR family transcriptional regulator [Solirubrobacteraceae bacterium]